MRTFSIAALVLAAALAPACAPPFRDALPPQRPRPLSASSACAPAADAAPRYNLGVLFGDGSTPWMWTEPLVEAEFPAPRSPVAAIAIRYFVTADGLRAQGQQTLRVLANGILAGEKKTFRDAEEDLVCPLPQTALKPGQPLIVRLGVLLGSIRLLRSPQ